MFLIDQLMIVAGILLILGIISSKFSARLGLPVLVLFVVIGMLAGSEGIGGIAFDNVGLAHGIGTVALALILFDGGLRTEMSAIRLAWRPSLVLATWGVLVTSIVTGVAAAWILDIPILQGVLLGSIVGSTDAAAVFSVIRSTGMRLRERIAAMLEIESGSNDPMAIFLTIALLQVLLGTLEPGPSVLSLFFLQMGVGAAVGLAGGFVSVRFVNRIGLQSAALYPVLLLSCGLFTYGLTVALGGSGFLAVYVAGIVIGNNRIVFERGNLLFHDGLAWTGQIAMFVVLGLLSFPSRLAGVAVEGLLVAGVLIFIARPVAIVPVLLAFRYSWREIVLVAWVGLKGAVPIILALFPLIFGLPGADLLFDVVFFVVLVSAVTQGWSLPLVARRLGLLEEGTTAAPVTLEITSLHDVNADIVEYKPGPESRAADRRLNELALPESAVVAMIARENALIPPRGSTRIQAGDHVFVMLQPRARPLVDRVFSDRIESSELPALVEFPLLGTTTVGDLREFYGIDLGIPDDRTLGGALRDRLGSDPEQGASVRVGSVILRVLDVADGRILSVGLVIPPGGE